MVCCSKPVNLAGLFAALADTTRLRLLNLIAGREVCVCFLVEILGQSQPTVSRHLAYLRKEGLVAARRQGKWMHYRLCEQPTAGAASVLTAALQALSGDRQMQAERSRLDRAIRMPQKLVTLEGAPRPTVLAQSGPRSI